MPKDSELNDRQKLFVSEYIIDRNATQENIIRTIVYLYIVSENEKVKKHSAWLISRLRPEIKLVGLETIVDIQELRTLAMKRQTEIVKADMLMQKRRHDKRTDFALTEIEWIDTLIYFDYKCSYCGEEKKLTYDHFIPFSQGGPFARKNIIPACASCNSSKGTKRFEEWFPKQSFYTEEREGKIIEYLKDGETDAQE